MSMEHQKKEMSHQEEVSLRMRAHLMERATERLTRLTQAVRTVDELEEDDTEGYKLAMTEMYEALEAAETFLGLG